MRGVVNQAAVEAQLQLIVHLLGRPSEEDMSILQHETAKRALRQMKGSGKPLSKVFPKATPQALDLLSKMLVFDPRKRISAAKVSQS